MAELWLVRHGQTDWNIAGLYQGQSDIPLNATGLQQAEELAQRLHGQTFVAAYSSDLQRALRTAEIALRDNSLPIQKDRRLREINQGEWEGKNYRQVIARFQQDDSSKVDTVNDRAPGGESVWDVAQRMAAAVDDIARAHPSGAVLVASHGLALATLVCRVKGYPLSEVYQHILDNAVPEVVHWPPEN